MALPNAQRRNSVMLPSIRKKYFSPPGENCSIIRISRFLDLINCLVFEGERKISETGGYKLLLIWVQCIQLLSFIGLFLSVRLHILSSECRRNLANNKVGAKSAMGIRNFNLRRSELEREICLNRSLK